MELLFQPNNFYGIRDPIILQNIDGKPFKIFDKYVIIFNTRTEEYHKQESETFPLVSYSYDFRNWSDPTLLFKDGKYTAVGSIIRKDDIYYIFYSANTKKGFKYATTKNLINFEINNTYILDQLYYKQISLMGLPFITNIDNKYICLFEGMSNKGFRIFGAESNNLINWKPINNGNPIYNGINEYEVLGQANPSLYKIKDKYMLFYNGKNKNEKWSGSYLVTNDFINYKSLKTPILDILKMENSYRIEGLRLVNINNKLLLIFFILPGIDSYKDGKIYQIIITLPKVL